MPRHPAHRFHAAARAALAMLALLAFVSSATAGTQPVERLRQVVATVAGRSVAVSCETNTTLWRQEVAAASMASQAAAYYDPNEDLIRFGPLVCAGAATSARGTSVAAVTALFVVAHEAAHAAGVEDEGVANCWGLYWAQDLARRFYGVGLFTAGSRQVLVHARQLQRGAPREYRSACPV